LATVIPNVDAERAEVEVLLKSRTFGRANSLGRFLGFVCEKYFENTVSEIKEYNIAVHALGRPPDFDPQTDTIVRVTAHTLRKRLELYYNGEGADHDVQIALPAGHYVPQFIYRKPGTNGRHGKAIEWAVSDSGEHDFPASVSQEPDPQVAFHPATAQRLLTRKLVIPSFVLAVVVIVSASYLLARKSSKHSPLSAAAVVPNSAASGIHALVGSDQTYVDRAGLTWMPDRFCSGGSAFSGEGHTILGTDDPQLFSSGRRGVFKCAYAVPAGTYEVHLLFAETAGLQENSRYVNFSLNGVASGSVDVVDDAGGDNIATEKVLTDVSPGSDGAIHLDFLSQDSFVNAVEILPGTPHRMLPVRIVADRSSYRDRSGNLWLPDRYFFGGRLSRFSGDLSALPDRGVYEGHRFGHFRYIIPVAPNEKYTLRLHFMEHWFGVQNGSVGGAGSRVFSVWCNGQVLLNTFDIYREAGAAPLIKTFNHLDPTPQGKIELYFTPSVNYPSVSAIEVIPES